MTRREFRALAEDRLRDVEALLQAGRFSAAYYLAGYAVECALKAHIASRTKQDDFPIKDAGSRYWIHKLGDLLKNSGIEPAWLTQCKADPAFQASWYVVRDWNEDSRYEVHTEQEARSLLEAISDPQHGVLPWLRNLW